MAVAGDIEQFEISVPQADLEELRRRLGETRWAAQPPIDDPWELGTDIGYVRELCEHWRDGHDWRATEARLNAHENVRWEGLHALIAGEGGGDADPVVFLHGWPSGPLEYLRAAELLAEGGRRVIVPSLPGYAWSDDPGESINVAGVSERLRALIERGLGLERYAVAGGDWGAIVAARIAYDSPGAVTALHVSTPGTLPVAGSLDEMSEGETEFVDEGMRWRRREGHHLLIQSTAPDVISPALADSPAGLAAYLVEKYRRWTGPGFERSFSPDTLCDFLTMFWTTGSIASSMRLYWGERNERWRLAPGEKIKAPAGVSVWPAEIINPPREWSERVLGDLRAWNEMPSGGHFAAFEEPEAYVADLAGFLGEVG